MSRNVYTARRYDPEKAIIRWEVKVSRDGDSQIARLDFVCASGSPEAKMRLTRTGVESLKKMLEEVLEDWQ